jgi:hypothetical protein
MKITRIQGDPPHGLVDLPQLPDSELGSTKGGSQWRVFKFRPSSLNPIHQNFVMIKGQSAHPIHTHPLSVGGIATRKRMGQVGGKGQVGNCDNPHTRIPSRPPVRPKLLQMNSPCVEPSLLGELTRGGGRQVLIWQHKTTG